MASTSMSYALSGGSTPATLTGNCVNMGEFGWRDRITRQPCSPIPISQSPPRTSLTAPGLLATSPGPSGTFGPNLTPIPPGSYPVISSGSTVTALGGAAPVSAPAPIGFAGPVGGSAPSGGSQWPLIAAGGAVLALLYFGSKDKRRRRRR